ncbi:MAG TPA: protein kinase [Bryobacteraceae bacterium]
MPEVVSAVGKAKMPVKIVAGRYELRELLGEGGMGLVYRAVDTRTGGFVAIKTMRDVSDPRTVEMFKKEWRFLARLSHPNIVDIRDVDEIEEEGIRKPCYVMPLLPGTTLATLIKDSGHRLTVDRVVGMLCQVCNGLEAAHKAGLIHRDLKPSNIFVMEDDTAKLIDFGLVYSADAKSVTGYKGTWQYMAPEQTEGKAPTVQSDIFSLGVVAYEAFTARKPFAKNTVEGTVEAIRTSMPPSISEINPKVTQLLSKVVHKAIAKQPLHRYASAREFAEILQKAHHGQSIERFETARILPRIERARRAFEKDDCAFASEILTELEAEGNVDPEIALLRAQIEEAVRQKRIRQLFEGAQTRLEQDEIPLALDKLREILELDPENADALAMRRRVEEERNSRQISDWLKLARQHLQLQDFGEARQALKEVLHIRYDDSDALALLAEVDLREKEAAKARAEKEQLYGSALRAYQVGEISTALSKLEKILEVSRRTPGAAIPERDAVYQSFYNRVRSERDTIDKAYEDGRRLLNEKDFEKALEICNRMLAQYPGSAQFHALKLKVEQSERQELSAYIAEVGRSVDAEPNLDRRVSILEEACRRYPQEAQFQQSLRLAREQRELVHSISAKAHQYEEQGQFADAIGQWKILRNIHPQYPGIEVEIAQLEKRREQQGQEEKKARLIEQIDHAIENGAYAKAVRLAGEALAEFSQDSELLVLERNARKNLERTEEAERLFDEARRLRAAGQFEEATAELERALKLDERNAGMRNALVSLLVERASLLLEKDRKLAAPLAQEAYELDPQHPAVKRLRSLINEAKRKDYVTQCVAEARELQMSGNFSGASARLTEGLKEYPDDLRLTQYQTTLQSGLHKEARSEKASREQPLPAEPVKTADTGFTTLYQRTAVFPRSIGQTVNMPEPPARPPEIAVTSARRHPKIWLAGAAAALLAVVAIILYFANHRKPPTPRHEPQNATLVSVPVTIRPEGAKLTVDGHPETDPVLRLAADKTYAVAISKPGYKPLTASGLSPEAKGWTFALEPEPLRMQVLTAERSGRILLDGREIWKLDQGDLLDFQVPADGAKHELLARNDTGDLFKVDFQAAEGAAPVVAPLAGPALVASTLGSDAKVYGSVPASSASVAGKAPVAITKDGSPIDLAGSEPDQTILTVATGEKREAILLPHGNAPVLLVSLHANPNLGSTTVTTSVESARLLFDGREKKARRPGYWHISATAGTHEIRLVADGYADDVRTVNIEKGQDLKQAIELTSGSSEIVIRGGIAGTEVLVDGKPLGTLDSSGALHASVAPGDHQIGLRKAGFEDLAITRPFAAGKAIALEGKEAVLKPFATINFAATPVFTTIRYRRAGEGEWQDGAAGSSARVKAGTYEVEGKAADYQTKTVEIEVSSGQVARAELHLEALPVAKKEAARAALLTDAFVNPDGLDAEKFPHWLTGKTSGFLDVKHKDRYAITFSDSAATQHGIFRRSNRFEWRLTVRPVDKQTLFSSAEIAYELQESRLTRRVKADGKVAKSTVVASAADGDSAYSVDVIPTAQGVRIATNKGQVIDEFTDPRFDWAHARLAIKGDTIFVVK